jgi:hypothetical protein
MSDAREPFDPEDPLAGWKAPARGRATQPDLDDVLGAVARQARRATAPAASADIDLPAVEAVDAASLDDLAGIGSSAATSARATALDFVERVDEAGSTDVPVVVGRRVPLRLLDRWQPGAWIGALRRIGDAMTEFVRTDRGPVIETYEAPHLFALWPPQRLEEPLLPRWPLRAGLASADGPAAADALLALTPGEASLWLASSDVDWALVAEIVLHHDPTLRPFQAEALRAFVQAEREAAFVRINDGYRRPEGGGAAERLPGHLPEHDRR